MTPARLLAPYPEVHLARRRAYELDICTGGSCMGNLVDGVPRRAKEFLKKLEEEDELNVREFSDASLEVQKLVAPWHIGGPARL